MVSRVPWDIVILLALGALFLVAYLTVVWYA